MADISYARKFKHEDWIENEDVVQADGERGFNKKFHGIEAEFDALAGVVSTIDKTIQRLNFIITQSVTNLAANTASSEFTIETYDRSALPANVEKVYFVVIFPNSSQATIQHTLLYRLTGANKITVSVQFFNLGTTAATFTFRVLTLAAQA
jgi:hypothetical protein